jgi:hypothetical protein
LNTVAYMGDWRSNGREIAAGSILGIRIGAAYFYTNFLGLDRRNWKENRRWIANEICVYEMDFLRQDPVLTSEIQVYITNRTSQGI